MVIFHSFLYIYRRVNHQPVKNCFVWLCRRFLQHSPPKGSSAHSLHTNRKSVSWLVHFFRAAKNQRRVGIHCSSSTWLLTIASFSWWIICKWVMASIAKCHAVVFGHASHPTFQAQKKGHSKPKLVGGLEHFLCSIVCGIILPID